MSDTPSTAQPSTASPEPAAARPAAQRRMFSPVGLIVIGILLLLLAVEGIATLRVSMVKSKLVNALAAAEAEKHELTRESVKSLLGGREPDVSTEIEVDVGEELYDLYFFNGLLKRRVLCVHYGVAGRQDADDSQREVMEVLTVVPEVVLFNAEEAEAQ